MTGISKTIGNSKISWPPLRSRYAHVLEAWSGGRTRCGLVVIKACLQWINHYLKMKVLLNWKKTRRLLWHLMMMKNQTTVWEMSYTIKNVHTSLDYSNAEKEPISDDVMSHDKSIEDTEEGPTTSGEVVSDAPPPQSPTTSENPFLIDEQVI